MMLKSDLSKRRFCPFTAMVNKLTVCVSTSFRLLTNSCMVKASVSLSGLPKPIVSMIFVGRSSIQRKHFSEFICSVQL